MPKKIYKKELKNKFNNTSVYHTSSCRHCSEGYKIKKASISGKIKLLTNPPYQKGVKRQKPVYKRRSDEQLYSLVKDYIVELSKRKPDFPRKGICTTAEQVAEKFQVKTHRIKFIFMQLNHIGLMHQRFNRPPHDSTREKGGWCSDSSWRASTYWIKPFNK